MSINNKDISLQNDSITYLKVEDRPLEVKNAIQSIFNQRSDKVGGWGLFNSDKQYNMSNLDDYKLIRKIVEGNPNQDSFNIIDIGAGDYSWLNSLSSLFNDGSELFANKSFNIFGLNCEGSPKVVEIGNVKLHYYGGFKSEDLLSEFQAKGHLLENNVDLIVSRWALRHMVDPMGVVLQAYDLLKPQTGLMLLDDFSIKYENLEGALLYESNPRAYEGHLKQFHIFSHLDANVLMCPSNTGARSYYHFNIQKLTADVAKLPVTYSGLAFNENRGNACKYETEFSSLISTKELKVFSSCFGVDLRYDACLGDKELYDWFENNSLFSNEADLRHYQYCGEIKNSGEVIDYNHQCDL